MSISARLAPRLRPLLSSATKSRPYATASKAVAEEWPQRTPLGPYYETILREPTQYERPEKVPPSPSPKVPAPEPQPPSTSEKSKPEPKASASLWVPSSPALSQSSPGEETPAERIGKILGSRVLTPEQIAARLATKESQSTYVAGILVPPQPEEPDNCCMSGCVNCVWERYREEMEEWTAKKAEAEKAISEQSGSMDSDGGGSESNWTPSVEVGDAKIAKDLWAKDVFEAIPPGIREFIKQEKRLKEQHAREGTVGS